MNCEPGGERWAVMTWTLEAVVIAYCWNDLFKVPGLALFYSKDPYRPLTEPP